MKKILIIEDEILIQKSLKKILSRKNHHVDSTSSGKKGIDLIYTNHYDIIICDLMLQDISGFDVIESSKKIMSSSEISKKFIIMTAYSSEQVINKVSSYHLTILKKPFHDIVETINIILK